MTVGAQELGSPTRSIRIPFRVLTAPGLGSTHIQHNTVNSPPYSTLTELLTYHPAIPPVPTGNPFLSPQEQQHPSLEEGLQMLTTEASRRASSKGLGPREVLYHCYSSSSKLLPFSLD